MLKSGISVGICLVTFVCFCNRVSCLAPPCGGKPKTIPRKLVKNRPRDPLPSSHYYLRSISWTSRTFYFPDSPDLLEVLRDFLGREREGGVEVSQKGVLMCGVAFFVPMAQSAQSGSGLKTPRRFTSCAAVQPLSLSLPCPGWQLAFRLALVLLLSRSPRRTRRSRRTLRRRSLQSAP